MNKMWKPLQKSPSYFIKCIKESDNLHYVGVTDYRNYWITNLSRKSFLSDLKETNEGLEFDDENELVERGLDMLTNPETLKKISIIPEDNNKFLTISMVKVYEFPLKMELGLLEASPEHFFESVIQPLLQTVCDLRSSQHELRELLKKKDREIEEYKIEGRAPKRLITTIYDDTAHMTKHTTYEKNFGLPDVAALLEATAYSNLKDQKTPGPSGKPTTTATEINQKVQASPSQKSDLNSSEMADSSAQLTKTDTSKQATKIEKYSQNSVIDEMKDITIVPTQIEETEIPGFVVQTNVEVLNGVEKTESSEITPRKRRKNRLNY